jgi:hypothetical protein
MTPKRRFWLIDWRWWVCAVVVSLAAATLIVDIDLDDSDWRWVVFVVASVLCVVLHNEWVRHDEQQ